MQYMKSTCVIALVLLLAAVGLALPSTPVVRADDDNRAPELPSPLCDTIQVDAGHKVSPTCTRSACRSNAGPVARGTSSGRWRISTPTQASAAGRHAHAGRARPHRPRVGEQQRQHGGSESRCPTRAASRIRRPSHG